MINPRYNIVRYSLETTERNSSAWTWATSNEANKRENAKNCALSPPKAFSPQTIFDLLHLLADIRNRRRPVVFRPVHNLKAAPEFFTNLAARQTWSKHPYRWIKRGSSYFVFLAKEAQKLNKSATSLQKNTNWSIFSFSGRLLAQRSRLSCSNSM